MTQDLSINDLEELIELSEIAYKKVYDSENSFTNIIEKTIIEYENEVYFITNAFKLAKYTKSESTCELTIYSHTFEKNKLNLEINFNTSDVFGRTPISTGFKKFDRKVKMFKGELVVIASRPTMGKTSFIAQLCNNQVKSNLSIGFYSLEQSKQDFYIKMLSQNTSIPVSNLLNNDLDDEMFIILNSSFESIQDKFLFDEKNYTLKGLILKIKKDFIFNKFDVVYIDCLQLIKSIASLEYRYLELNQISRELKILAKELNILIIATSELNRNVESRFDKRPLLIDLRDSGTIEDDADKVIFMYRDDIYKEREEAQKRAEAWANGEEYKSRYIASPVKEVEFIIGKQRNGPTGTLKMHFQPLISSFFEIDYLKKTEPIEIVFNDDTEKEMDIEDIL